MHLKLSFNCFKQHAGRAWILDRAWPSLWSVFMKSIRDHKNKQRIRCYRRHAFRSTAPITTLKLVRFPLLKLDIAFAIKMPTSNYSKQMLIGDLKKSHVMCRSLFCSPVFKTMSNVLNSDVNKYCLDCFLFAGGDKVAHLPMSSLRRRNTRYLNVEKAKTNDDCVTDYRPARDPLKGILIGPLEDNLSLFHYVIGISGIVPYNRNVT